MERLDREKVAEMKKMRLEIEYELKLRQLEKQVRMARDR